MPVTARLICTALRAPRQLAAQLGAWERGVRGPTGTQHEGTWSGITHRWSYKVSECRRPHGELRVLSLVGTRGEEGKACLCFSGSREDGLGFFSSSG